MQDIELDAHTWRGLEYLESISGPGAIAEMVGAFAQDAPGRLGRMRSALEAGEWQALSRLAHDLKSNSAAVGVLRLSSLAAQIEHGAQNGSTPDLASWVEEAETMLPRVLVALEEKARLYPA